MKVIRRVIVFDASDIEAESRFLVVPHRFHVEEEVERARSPGVTACRRPLANKAATAPSASRS